MLRRRARDHLDGAAAISAHQHRCFLGHGVQERRWLGGPIATRVEGLYVHEFAPGPRSAAWTYATVGVWDATHAESGHGLEFVMSSPRQDDRLVELLTITAYHHAGPSSQRLDLGHTMPIGEPWLPSSTCDHLLVSVPYPYGPDLEICEWRFGHARHLWLLPITEPERDFKKLHGLEALEQAFEDAPMIPTDPQRPSVV